MAAKKSRSVELIDWIRAAQIAGVSASTIRRLIAQGRFPVPIQASPRHRRFILNEVVAWREANPPR